MALTSADLTAAMSFQLSVANSPFSSANLGPDSTLSFSLGGLTAAFNEPYAQQLTIAHGATTTIDFSTFNDLLLQAAGFSQIFALFVMPTGVSTATAILAPGASNPLTWFFGGTTPTITVPVGGIFVFGQPTSAAGQTVDSTHKTLAITAGGTGTLTVLVGALGLH